MPRVAHVISTPAGIGGAEQVLLALVEEGTRREWTQLVLNPFSLDPVGSELAKRSAAPLLGYRAVGLRDLPGMRKWLKAELEQFGPDIVHAHLFHALVSVASLPRLGDEVRILSHQHGDRMRSEGRRWEARLDRWGGSRFDKIIACSEWVSRFLIDEYRYPRRKVTAIRNGWAGRPLPREPAGMPTVVSVANFRPAKGHSVLLRAFATVVHELPLARLLLLGEGPLRQELQDEAASLGISSNVVFEGSVTDVWPYLARANVSVLPSLNETLGIAALESMAAGLPVVASDVGGLPELVDDGVTGYRVPPGLPDPLGAALVRVLKSPDLGERLGTRGRDKAASMGMAGMTQRYFNLYAETPDLVT